MIGMGYIEMISSQCRLSNAKRLLKGGFDSKLLAANIWKMVTELHEMVRERKEGR
jgi:hypothetical protein